MPVQSLLIAISVGPEAVWPTLSWPAAGSNDFGGGIFGRRQLNVLSLTVRQLGLVVLPWLRDGSGLSGVRHG